MTGIEAKAIVDAAESAGYTPKRIARMLKRSVRAVQTFDERENVQFATASALERLSRRVGRKRRKT